MSGPPSSLTASPPLSNPTLSTDSPSNATPVSGQAGKGASHVRGVIREQFATEVNHKEDELEMIEERIQLAKMLLQRLRLGVLAQHYGVAAFYPTALDYREETIGEQHNWEMFEEFMAQDGNAESAQPEGAKEEDKAESAQPEGGKENKAESAQPEGGKADHPPDNVPVDTSNAELSRPEDRNVDSADFQDQDLLPEEATPPLSDTSPPTKDVPLPDENLRESRFYYKKRVIVGNTSQYLDPTAHGTKGDGSTHKWMVYVRGSQSEPSIGHFIKAVRFFLHPSYHPNDIVRVKNPPFHLTRLGWGEFPVRVQLEFCDRSNKSVDIIHNLVLDRTHTGQQTLGAETVVDLDVVAPPPEEGKVLRLNGLSSTLHDMDTCCSPSTSLSLLPPAPIQMDHDDPTPPCSPSPQCALPLTFSSGVLTTNLDKCLHNAVRNIPIYGKPNPSEDFYIPAPSLAQYRLWHIGRRRATEWVRAVAIRKSIARRLQLPGLLSTKQVLQWCRQNGYTPLDPVPACGRGFCKVCGCQLEAGHDEDEEDWGDEMEDEGNDVGVARKCPEVHEHCQIMMFGRHGIPLRGNTMDPFEELHPATVNVEEEGGITPLPRLCSLTEPHKLMAKVFSLQTTFEEQAKGDEDVDVCVLPSSPSCARSRALVDMVPRFRVPQTPELKWIQQTSASVGIHIYPAVIDRMYAHVVEHMVYISCTRFLRGILAQAVQGAGQMLDGKLSQDRVLTPFHLQQAILKLEHCDFLTSQYMGVQPCGKEGVACSDSDTSTLDSSVEEGEYT